MLSRAFRKGAWLWNLRDCQRRCEWRYLLGSCNDGDDCHLAVVKYCFLDADGQAVNSLVYVTSIFICIMRCTAFSKSASISKNAACTHCWSRSESWYEHSVAMFAGLTLRQHRTLCHDGCDDGFCKRDYDQCLTWREFYAKFFCGIARGVTIIVSYYLTGMASCRVAGFQNDDLCLFNRLCRYRSEVIFLAERWNGIYSQNEWVLIPKEGTLLNKFSRKEENIETPINFKSITINQTPYGAKSSWQGTCVYQW